jgi:hypothetical protein
LDRARAVWQACNDHPRSVQGAAFLTSLPTISLCDNSYSMAQAVSRRPLTAEVRVRSQNNPCRICGGQSDGGTGFCSSASISPCSMMLHTLSLTHYHKCHIILENDSVNKQHSRHEVGKFFYWDDSANQQFYNLSALAKS